MTSLSVQERKGCEGNAEIKGASQWTACFSAAGGYEADQPCVNGIPHPQMEDGENHPRENVEHFSFALHLISLVMCCVKSHSDKLDQKYRSIQVGLQISPSACQYLASCTFSHRHQTTRLVFGFLVFVHLSPLSFE